MMCPICDAPTQVVDTRGTVRRRRCKENPAHVFETTERVSFIGSRKVGRPPGTRKQQNSWRGLS